MPELSIIATFPSAKQAAAHVAPLRDLFTAHTEEAADSEERITAATRAFAKRFGKTWRKPLTWGDEGLEDNLPGVAAVGASLFVFHDWWDASADLATLLKAAGAKVSTVQGPPVLRVEVTFEAGAAGKKLRSELEALFAQREEAHLCDWQQPAWSTGRFLGETDDVWRTFEGDRCTFTFPVAPHDLDGFTQFASRGAKTLVVAHATSRDVAALKKRELAEAPQEPVEIAKTATAVGPIPQTLPRVVRVAKGSDAFCPKRFASNGKQLLSVGFSSFASLDPKTGKAKVSDVGSYGEDLCLHEATLWVCGYDGVQRSTDAGKRFVDLDVPNHKDGAPMLYAIARDAQGVLWVGGHGGRLLSCSDGKAFVPSKGLGRGTVKRLVDTPLGVLVLDFDGQIGVIANGKLRKAPVREALGLQDVCVTPAGTIVAVGGRHNESVVQRSTDAGVTFTKGTAPPVALQAIAALPDGRLIAAGGTAVLVSLDDGATFTRLDHEASAADRTYATAVLHGDSVFVSGPWQDFVRVDAQG